MTLERHNLRFSRTSKHRKRGVTRLVQIIRFGEPLFSITWQEMDPRFTKLGFRSQATMLV